MKYCPGCMCPQPAVPICPFCHFQESAYRPAQTALPIGTHVGPYLLGAMVASSRQAQCYAALDTRTERPVLVEEFFPFSVSGREPGKSLVVVGKRGQNYEQGLALFLRSTQPRSMVLRETLLENNTGYRIYELASLVPPDQQAAKLLDNPIFFRDAQGHALMSINTLPIPAMPKKQVIKLKKQKGKGLAVGVAAAVVALGLATGGVLYLTRKPAPTVQPGDYLVHTSTAMYETAKADRLIQQLPAETHVRVESQENGWAYCIYEDGDTLVTGYVPVSALRQMTESGYNAYAKLYATPTPTATPEPTPTPSPTPTPVLTDTPTPTPSITPTAAPTDTPALETIAASAETENVSATEVPGEAAEQTGEEAPIQLGEGSAKRAEPSDVRIHVEKDTEVSCDDKTVQLRKGQTGKLSRFADENGILFFKIDNDNDNGEYSAAFTDALKLQVQLIDKEFQRTWGQSKGLKCNSRYTLDEPPKADGMFYTVRYGKKRYNIPRDACAQKEGGR